jgi:hypothetical protein
MDRTTFQHTYTCDRCWYFKPEPEKTDGDCCFDSTTVRKYKSDFCSDFAAFIEVQVGTVDESMIPSMYEGIHEDEEN